MNRTLFAAASGMVAQQYDLEVIADDLANADVTGFKGKRACFAELAAPGMPGNGTVAVGARPDFSQGKLVKAGGAFDLALDGEGFFCVRDLHGRCGFTRDGSFARTADGRLRNAQGWYLDGVRIPADAVHVRVGDDGVVHATCARGERNAGTVRIVVFPAPEYLRAAGGTTFVQVPQAGAPIPVRLGAASGTILRTGMLERSNVSIIEAMMRMLAAQRAYEANAKGVQAADEMLRIADNLDRG